MRSSGTISTRVTRWEAPHKACQIPAVPHNRIPQYDHYHLDRTPRESKSKRISKLRVLTFKSWWFEDREEPSLGSETSVGGGLKDHYVRLTFDLHSCRLNIS